MLSFQQQLKHAATGRLKKRRRRRGECKEKDRREEWERCGEVNVSLAALKAKHQKWIRVNLFNMCLHQLCSQVHFPSLSLSPLLLFLPFSSYQMLPFNQRAKMEIYGHWFNLLSLSLFITPPLSHRTTNVWSFCSGFISISPLQRSEERRY